MTVQEIINRARRLTYINSVQYPDAQALEDFNIIYKELCNRITQEVNEDYFFDIFFTDTVVGQNEYVLAPNMFKLQEISIKYNENDVYYTKAISTEVEMMPKDSGYYEVNQSTSNPFYEIDDNSIFIYPTITTAITNGIKMKAIIKPTSLAISATEEEILLPTEYHNIIAEGMKQFAYQSRGKINEKNDAISEYKMKLEDMIFELTNRNSMPTTGQLPNLEYYA